MNFKSITPQEITENAFKLIGNDWMLITAGDKKENNMMTASWGGFGIMWHKPVAYIVVRPQRHTFSFLEKHDSFTLSFFTDEFREQLTFCGKNSGKCLDKFKETGFNRLFLDSGNVAIQESKLIVECKKLYTHVYDKENMLDESLDSFYPAKDYHKLYIAEITNCLIPE